MNYITSTGKNQSCAACDQQCEYIIRVKNERNALLKQREEILKPIREVFKDKIQSLPVDVQNHLLSKGSAYRAINESLGIADKELI